MTKSQQPVVTPNAIIKQWRGNGENKYRHLTDCLADLVAYSRTIVARNEVTRRNGEYEACITIIHQIGLLLFEIGGPALMKVVAFRANKGDDDYCYRWWEGIAGTDWWLKIGDL